MRTHHGDGDGGDDGGSEAIDVEDVGGVTVVRPHGEMDIVRAAAFHEALLSALRREVHPHEVCVDLRYLAFSDSSGLNALLTARATANETGQRLYLAGPNPQFIRLLEITGAIDLFTIEPAPPS
ncbi:STAS domain-containing protein [Streptomyces sp. NPDC059072]|uniref:STAS domain-containing protein n=1 Tax=Streptomyces sp. NPDC059072 TaxID=3346715 RepID=UPI0036A822F6